MTHFADRWSYDSNDSCARFFTACLKAARYDIPAGAHVLEVGSAEFNWIRHMAHDCPDIAVTGIDWRKNPGIQGDVLTHDFDPASFDACVSISAIEHIGLGHYGDPVDVDGDSKAIARVWSWLKPGGILFFDVPYNPEGYQVVGTSHREYDDAALQARFAGAWRELWRGYAYAGSTHQLLPEKPTTKAQPFYYCGMVWQKV